MTQLNKTTVKQAVAVAQAQYRERMKPTLERIDDLQSLFEAARFLANNGVVIHHFYSTDAKPVICVEPCANFKQMIVGKAVHIDGRLRCGQVVNVDYHVDFFGVEAHWCELEVKPKKMPFVKHVRCVVPEAEVKGGE